MQVASAKPVWQLPVKERVHVEIPQGSESSALLQRSYAVDADGEAIEDNANAIHGTKASFTVDAAASALSIDDLDDEAEYQEKSGTASSKGLNKNRRFMGIPLEPPLVGVMPGLERPHFIMGVDVDYPPYAYLPAAKDVTNPSDVDEVVGVGTDMIKAMGQHCGFDVTVVQAHWSDCWGKGEIGQGLLKGWYHGCMTYTHATGVRNRYLEFSDSWATPNKPSGLIVKLVDGKPAITGADDLSGKTIVDVTGWAPTADTVKFVKNKCTGEKFGDVKIIQGDDLVLDDPSVAFGANDRGLAAILEGKADAMWIYGDQAANYQCGPNQVESGWNCDLWRGFGTTYGYLHSGMYGWMYNGTTIAMSRKGSGVSKILDDCFVDFQKTEEFYKVCKTQHGSPPHDQMATCLPNEYFHKDPDFKAPDVHHYPYLFATNEHSDCSTGYCPCASMNVHPNEH